MSGASRTGRHHAPAHDDGMSRVSGPAFF